MKFIPEEFATYDEVISADGQGMSIELRFCNDCPFFDIDGVQPDPNVIRGHCNRLSFEGEGKYTPHYIRVDNTSFCNEKHIGGEDGREIL